MEPIAIIGGSSAYILLKEEVLGNELECVNIDTPFGKSANIHRFRYGNRTFLFMSRHGDEGYALSAPFVNYRANIWGLKELGVERIISWSGPGIINQKYSIGDYVIPDDYIDETKKRVSTFFEKKGIGFIRQKEPFCFEIREMLLDAAAKTNIKTHNSGVYLCTEGPRLETRSEIKKYSLLGGDMVGMTLLPEAILARELEICYAPICYMTNYAEGIIDRPYKKGELFEGMMTEEEMISVNRAVRRFSDIIKTAVSSLHEKKRECGCKDAMLRYKKREDIGWDYHRWI